MEAAIEKMRAKEEQLIFRIGEFSKLTQVSIRMLRYYDEMDIFKPAEIDHDTGYRLYSVEQIPDLHKIIFLRDIGFQVSEMAVILNNWDKDYISAQLKNRRQEIETIIRSDQEKIHRIDIAIQDLQEEKMSMNYNVALKTIPAYQVLSHRRIIPDYFSEGLLWQELYAYVEQEHLNIPLNSECFAIYHDLDYKDADVDVEVCVLVNQKGADKDGFLFRETEHVDTMACAMVYGPYENIADAYAAFAQWLTKNQPYRMSGQSRQICHRGPWNESDPDKYLTEIQIPVEKLALLKFDP